MEACSTTDQEDTPSGIWLLDRLLLGVGGKDPLLVSLHVSSGDVQQLIKLPPGHSAYAIDIDLDGTSAAVGTKGGLVYLIDDLNDCGPDGAIRPKELVQGGPVLSVCWLNRTLLAVSDALGRCCVWNSQEQSPPRLFEVIDGVVCSLLRLPDGLLVGITSTGHLLFWHPPELCLVHMVKIAPPPSMSGLVRMVYWPCEHALACPGAGGRLTLYDLEKRAVVETSAHQGDFYAISVLGKKLFTVGFKESQLKTWDGGLEDPTYSLRAPTGVISAGVGGCPPAEILLIEARGAASAWTLQAGKLRLARQHAGQDYRAVCCPRADRVQIVYAQQRREEVQRIVTKIGEHSAQADADNTEELHARLIDLNCEHVSLALRADQAYQRGNIVQALTLYSSLIRILPTDDPNACASMERYAAMLAKAWQIPEAAQILTRIQKLDPDYQLTAQTENLVHLAKILRDRHWVINPGMPIEDIIQSATAIGRGFIGRYVINKGHPQGCGSTQLEAAEIAEKYEQARRESGETSLPPAGAERVWWLSEMQVQKMDLVSFGEGRTNPIRGLQLALQVLTTASKTTVILTVLFDWRDASKAVDLEAQNDQAHNALTQIRNRTLSNSYLGGIHKTLQHCLRRLLTERSSYQGAS